MSEGYLTTQDGVRLFFRSVGSGSPTVLIPNSTYMFDDFSHLARDRSIVFYDLRNRGRSDSISDPAQLAGGVHNDVEDLEAVRRYFGTDKASVIGHSYLGMVVVLHAMKYPAHVNRLVQIGPVQPLMDKRYPPHLAGADATMAEVSEKLRQLQQENPSGEAGELDKKMWSLMRQLYVADPADVGKITWTVDDLPNETLGRLMKYYNENLLPSMQRLRLTEEALARLTTPVLIIHGKRDRQAPYGGSQDWARMLPNARLITIESGAHLPWIESPDIVFSSIKTFLDGDWPSAAQVV